MRRQPKKILLKVSAASVVLTMLDRLIDQLQREKVSDADAERIADKCETLAGLARGCAAPEPGGPTT